ncbi:hypothetical protein ABPG77_008145 [Micractinium sp. CCAP 211/92]
MTTENGHPQRLTSLAGRTQQLASESYTAVKQRLPEAVKPRVEKLEEAVGSAAAPYVHRAQDTGATLLRAADERVDAALNSASKVYTDNTAYLQQQLARQKEFHSANLETYRQAREAYLKKVEDGVEYLKQKGLVGATRDAADEVLARVGEAKAAVLHAPAVLLQKVQEALDRLLAFGPVDRAVQAAKPRLEAARGQYLQYHDKVVASQQYKQAYNLANDLAARAQATWLYSKAKQNLLPLAQPAVDTVLSSPYYTSLVQHLQPIEAGRA